MSKETKRKLSWLAVICMTLSLFVLAFTMGFRNPERVREMTLVAKEMAFYLEGSNLPNPPLMFHIGEEVRIRFINQDFGMLHDVAFNELGVATGKVRYGEEAVVEFRPKLLKESEYLCTFHPAAMKGKLLVQ